jgi:hypothetical protein
VRRELTELTRNSVNFEQPSGQTFAPDGEPFAPSCPSCGALLRPCTILV